MYAASKSFPVRAGLGILAQLRDPQWGTFPAYFARADSILPPGRVESSGYDGRHFFS